MRTLHITLAMLALMQSANAAGVCRALIVAGDPGPETQFAERFDGWAKRWQGTLKGEHGVADANIIVLRSPARPLQGEPDPFTVVEGATPAKPPAPELLNVSEKELASRDNVLAALKRIVEASTADDQVLLVLLGHGYDSQNISKLCLPGKDLSDTDVAAALKTLKAKQFVCIATSPSSAYFVKSLTGKGRVIITAAATPGLRSETIFNEFLLRALKGGKANLLDAFNKASLDTIRWYQNQFVKKSEITVHGKEFQEVFAVMYPGRKMTTGSAEPQKATNDMAQMSAWLDRRVIAEVSGLDDNGDGDPSTVFEDGKEPAALPGKSGDGDFARGVVLGKP